MPDPLPLTLDTQTFYLCARDAQTVLTQQEQTVTKTALRRAQREIMQATWRTADALSELGEKEFGTVNSPHFKGDTKVQAFFDIMLAAFRLSPPHDPTASARIAADAGDATALARIAETTRLNVKLYKGRTQRDYRLEDYRRCLRHIQPMLKLLWNGLTRDGLVLADVAASSSSASIGGYVDPPWYQLLQIRLAYNFRKFWEEGEVRGPIHLNLKLLVNDERTLARTLIHEATHKFGRTNDVAYYKKTSAPDLITKMAKTRLEATPGLDEEVQKVLKANTLDGCVREASSTETGKVPHKMTPEEALNNADSHAYFITWMAEHVSL